MAPWFRRIPRAWNELADWGIVSAASSPWSSSGRRRRMHTPNKFTLIRIFLVFNQCRIRSDTRLADRRASAKHTGYRHAHSLAAGVLGAVKLTVVDYARTQGGPG
jgi:hypothetical protein